MRLSESLEFINDLDAPMLGAILKDPTLVMFAYILGGIGALFWVPMGVLTAAGLFVLGICDVTATNAAADEADGDREPPLLVAASTVVTDDGDDAVHTELRAQAAAVLLPATASPLSHQSAQSASPPTTLETLDRTGNGRSDGLLSRPSVRPFGAFQGTRPDRPVAVRSQSDEQDQTVWCVSGHETRPSSGSPVTRTGFSNASPPTTLETLDRTGNGRSDGSPVASIRPCPTISLDDDDVLATAFHGVLTGVKIDQFKEMMPEGGTISLEGLEDAGYEAKAKAAVLAFIAEYSPSSIEVVAWWALGIYRKSGSSPAAVKWRAASDWIKKIQSESP